jgi:nucleoid-associated protein YgaU
MNNPELAVIRALQVLIVILAAYVLLVTIAGITLRLMGAHPLARALDRVTPAVARRAVAAALGVALAAPGTAAANDPPVMHRLPDTTTTTTTTTTTVTSPVTTPLAPPPPALPAASSPSPPATWTIRPGDHFWRLAEAVLAEAWGRQPTDSEVVPYWRDLIAANRTRLRDPANANLVYPAQLMLVPAPPRYPTRS